MNNQIMQAMTQQSRRDLLSFCVYTDKFFEVNNHHELISKKLQGFMNGSIKRLILQTPPRSGKSRLVCESIAHAMGTLNNTDIIYTGHSISLLESFSRNIRNRIDSIEYKSLFKAKIKEGNGAIQSWSTDNNNQLMIFGVGGGITGRGGHRLIIDDPYATRQDAESDTIRARVWEWYLSTFYSRRHDENAGICIIMQRWREDDLIGQILEQDNSWEIVKIPAINEQGESFWDSRFSVAELNNIRGQLGEYFFQSQYMQDPINEGGGDFIRDYIQFYDDNEYHRIKQHLDVVTFIDPAISEKQEADNTAIVTIGLDKRSNNIYILEVDAGHFLPDVIIQKTFDTFLKWNPRRIGIESVQYQKMLILEIQKQMRIRNIFFTLDEIHPQGEKVARIRSILQPRYSNRTILHRNYMGELEAELLKFPNSKHDDRIDALTGAVNMLNTHIIGKKTNEVYIPSYI